MANPDKRSYFVAVNDRGRVLGGIGVDMFENLHGYAELQKLYVSEDCRGEGIATHLIERSEYAVHETMDTFFIKELGDNK